ncbi:hypothetical protein HNQ80_005066 [Anaerosolibacter carboniphilus]|uniref:DUF4393 domain-containing protein n=1 Tax=Anaerosolibacter carboniphilus TaxID=1417629 RepID=A0A841KZG0_9FIRM|nr:hypothetical protein [Anaerosolibacter carboniphilus]MBB6218891.1 hypothetical protein [Anaerosolibacter carboniphilus]
MNSISEKVKSLISLSAEVVGTATAEGALGFFAGGMPGAVAGACKGATKAAIKRITQNTLTDVSNRILSQREEVRVGTAASYAIIKIIMHLNEGKEPRSDFFLGDPTERSAADEIFEGVLLKCKNEHEEKKIRYISNIFSNAAFVDDITLGEANFRLNIAEGMTYRQFCILNLFERKTLDTSIILRSEDYIQGEKTFELRSILNEIYELYNKGMIEYYKSEDGRAFSLSGILSIIPKDMRLTKHGKRQYELMGLGDMDKSELIDIWVQLS